MIMVSILFVQCHQEFFVVDGFGHAVFQEFHGFDGCHVGEVVAQGPYARQGAFVDQKVVAARTRSHNVDGREDALVRQTAVDPSREHS